MALTIRTDPETEKLMEKLKKHYDVGSASKALLMAARYVVNDYKADVEKYSLLDFAFKDLEEKYGNIIETIREKNKLDRELIDILDAN